MSSPARHGHRSRASITSAISIPHFGIDILAETEHLNYNASPRKLGTTRFRAGSLYTHHVSASISSSASSSSSSSTATTHFLSLPHKAAVIRHISRTFKTVFLAPVECLSVLHPRNWSISAHITDQASIALLCYKLYVLSITIPAWSKLYFYYLPSCLLSDIVAVALLQLGWWMLFASSSNAVSAKEPEEVEIGGYVKTSSESGIWRGRIASFLLAPVEYLSRSSDYTALPLGSPAIATQKYENAPQALDKEDERGIGQASDSSNQMRPYALLKIAALTTFRILHLLACMVAIVFTVIAIGAYSAGRVVFSWQGAFDSSSQSGYLFGYAMTEFPHFLYTYLTILSLGTAVTLSRYWIPYWIENGTIASEINKHTPASGKVRAGIVTLAVVSFLAVCASVRPPNALPATDLLIDGITATSALLLFSDDHTHPIALNKNTTIYGQSNAFQPRLTPIDSDKIEHVFFLFLESADHLAWPYQPDQFCKHRNCEDMPEKYNKVEEFTPFFNDLIKSDPHSVFIEDFRTNLAYTIKSQLSSMCGVMPHVKDQVTSEAEMRTATGCLPEIVKRLNDGDAKESKWKTGWFQAQITAYDSQNIVIGKEGFDDVFDVTNMTAKTGKKDYTNVFGYSDEELHPFVWNWVDERLKNKERIFLTVPGATMHHPFTVPPFAKTLQYTKTEWVNNYLNVVKRTDADLKRFFDNLKKRNLLDKSLIVLQGDHGPRIGEDGVYTDAGWYERTYRAPLLIRAPGLLPHQIEQDPLRPFLSIDILPTILDALGVSPSLIKSFIGQSIFRARNTRHVRDSYHSQSKGAQFPHHLRFTAQNRYKAVRMMKTGDTCAIDLNVDPSEKFFYCIMEGWRKVFEGDELKDGLMMGMYKAGHQEETELMEYAREAHGLIDAHLEVNADFWNVERRKKENDILMEGFLQAVHEQGHWS